MQFKLLARTFATGFGSGYFPWAPGTVGSVACLVLWYLFSVVGLLEPGWKMLILILLVAVFGMLATANYLEQLGPDSKHKDPKQIVIDEWAGLLVALCYVSHTNCIKVLVAFCLFRFFDILKPSLIRKAERMEGATGVMVDDLLAGILSAMLIAIYDVILIFNG